MYTREMLDRQRNARKDVERREGRVLAVVAVGGALAQLGFIRWVEPRLVHRQAVLAEAIVFLVYLTLVGWLLWRMQRRIRATRIRCPRCGVLLGDVSERLAVATGRCDSCGGQVMETGTPS
jgi:ribosomal protein S27AE